MMAKLVLLAWTMASAPPAPIGLEEAVTRALANAPDAVIAEAMVDVAEAGVTGAEVFPTNPVGSVQVIPRYNYVGRPAVGLSFGVAQALPLFGRWGDGVDVAETRAEAARHRGDDQRLQLVAAVERAYISAQREVARLKLVDANIDATADLLHMARTQYDAGAGTLVDVNVWRVELSRAKSQRHQQEAQVRIACANLARLVGETVALLTPSDALELPTLLPSPVLDAPPDRPDLKALDADVSSSRADRALQSSRAWPDVTLGAAVTTQDVGFSPLGQSGYIAGLLTLSAPLPLFEHNQGGRARAEAAVRLAEATQRRARLDAQQQVRAAHWQLVGSIEAADELRDGGLASAAETVRLQRRIYEAGQGDAAGLVLAQRARLDTELLHLDLVATACLAEIDLAVSIGASRRNSRK